MKYEYRINETFKSHKQRQIFTYFICSLFYSW